MRETVNGPETIFNLAKVSADEVDASQLPDVLLPGGITDARKTYLLHNVLEFCRPENRDGFKNAVGWIMLRTANNLCNYVPTCNYQKICRLCSAICKLPGQPTNWQIGLANLQIGQIARLHVTYTYIFKNLRSTTQDYTALRSTTQDYTALHSTTQYYTALHSTTQYYTVLHSTTQYYTALHSTTQYYTVLHTQHSTTQHNTVLHSTTQYYTTLRSTTQHYTALRSTTQHYTALHSTTQHYTVLHSTTQHYTALRSTTQHYTVLHSTTQYYAVLHSTTQHYTARRLLRSSRVRFEIFSLLDSSRIVRFWRGPWTPHHAGGPMLPV